MIPFLPTLLGNQGPFPHQGITNNGMAFLKKKAPNWKEGKEKFHPGLIRRRVKFPPKLIKEKCQGIMPTRE